ATSDNTTGKSSKQRKCRVGLVEDPPEERERNLEIYMRVVFINGIRTVMEVIDKIDPEFVEWGMGRLVEAKRRVYRLQARGHRGERPSFRWHSRASGGWGRRHTRDWDTYRREADGRSRSRLEQGVQVSRYRGARGREVVHGDGAGWEKDAQQAQRRESERHVRASSNNRRADEPRRFRQSVQGARAIIFRHGEHGHKCHADRPGHDHRRARARNRA
ncbi:unnamed protein product, partial [Ectocarpus sp. 4 AP-2014]